MAYIFPIDVREVWQRQAGRQVKLKLLAAVPTEAAAMSAWLGAKRDQKGDGFRLFTIGRQLLAQGKRYTVHSTHTHTPCWALLFHAS